MIYTNITGKFIGECMTGFGINCPINILNSGNSDVFYSFQSDDSNFTLSAPNLYIPNGGSGYLDVYFYPTFTNLSGFESGIVTITSESAEDGSVDPSGNISIYLTGHRLVNTTGGHVRNFRALRNYNPDKGLSYTFYWKPPTGISYLNNYFITGYKLEISTSDGFSPIDASKLIEIPTNNYDPRYGTFKGYSNDDIFTNINAYNDGTKFILDTPYYARIYTLVNNVTGESVYATGIDELYTPVSNEVITGNVSVKNNLVFTKKALDVVIPSAQKYVNYNLYDAIIKTNNNNNNFIYISGINAYLPSNTVFSSNNENLYSINLQGDLKNFTGNPTYGTNINIYVEDTTSILGYEGKGGDLKGIMQDQKLSEYKQSIQALYDKKDPTCTDATNGGSVFNFNIKAIKSNESSVTDINYNIIKKSGSKILAGGGGSKACVIWIYGTGNPSNFFSFVAADKNDNYYHLIFYLNGNNNSDKTTNLTVYSTTMAGTATWIKPGKELGFTLKEGDIYGQLSTWKVAAGEDNTNVNPAYLRRQGIFTNTLNGLQLTNFVPSTISNPDVINLKQIDQNLEYIYASPINNSLTYAGKIINGASDSKVKVYPVSSSIPSDYVFRFNSANISNSDPTLIKWFDSTNTVDLHGPKPTVGESVIYNNSIYNHVGKNSITLHSNQYVIGQFDSVYNPSIDQNIINKDCSEFDLYMVLSYRPVTKETDSYLGNSVYKTSRFHLFDWVMNWQTNDTKQCSISKYPYTSQDWIYTKEPNVFSFLLFPLLKVFIVNANLPYIGNNLNPIQLSKSLYNVTDYYPFILNIKRTGLTYSFYINSLLVQVINVSNTNVVNFQKDIDTLIMKNITSSQLKLSSGCTLTNGSNFETMSYFDIVFYNKILNSLETKDLYSYYYKEYFKLFTGDTNDYIDLKSNRIRLPNIFSIAGKV